VKSVIKRYIYIIISIVILLGVTSLPVVQKESETFSSSVPDFPVFDVIEGALNEYDKSELIGMSFEASITELAELLDRGVFTSEELTAYYLERIETYNPDFNCFISFCDEAMETARLRDEQRANGEILGKLHGIPIVIKAIRYTSKKAPPPCFAARFGKRQALPRPTAEPIAASINVALEPHVERLVSDINFTLLFKLKLLQYFLFFVF